jgi:hypothetical protein
MEYIPCFGFGFGFGFGFAKLTLFTRDCCAHCVRSQ